MFFSTELSMLLATSIFVAAGHTQKFEINPRIYRGEKAQPNQFPYMVSLRQLKKSDGGHLEYKHFCGAALIGQRWVISASHCLCRDRLNVSNIGIFVGVHHHSRDGQMYKVQQIIKHKNFDKVSKMNDISVLQTLSPVAYNEKVQPIPISEEWIAHGRQGVFAGFGVTEFGYPFYLKYILLRVIANDECIKMHVTRNKGLIHDSVLCTFAGYGSGTGNGDSGGILVIDGRLVGVLSWGIPNAIGRPEQFTRISNFTT